MSDKATKKTYVPMDDYEKNGYEPFGKRKEHFCVACKKYYAKIYQDGLTKNPFPPRCQGDVRLSIPTQEEVGLTDDEYLEARILSDPILFGQVHFNAEPRWYQEEYLACTANRKVFRAGRRTGKSYSLEWYILWYAWTHENHNVLVIAPYQAQVTKLFNDMRKLIGQSPEMKALADIKVSPPVQITFPNGTMIIGFASGKGTGQHSDQIRGQDAHLIALDEMDLMQDYDLEVVSSIMISHPDVQITGCATPKGWRRFFHRWATVKDERFKEFHYIAAEAPTWGPEAEEFFRSNFSKSGYEHEILAEFGEPEEGVFSPAAIELSLEDYSLSGYQLTEGTPRILGVDWNSTYGTHIALVEYIEGKYRLAKKTVIPKSEFTQHKGVDAVLRLTKEYAPNFIYVDHGYGAVQIEMLKLAGLEDPSSELYERLRPIQMGNSITIEEPGTGIMQKRQTKQYMVEMAVLHLEEGRCILPIEEDTSVIAEPGQESAVMGIVQQMRTFRVTRLTNTGAPVYSQDYEHTLTAWMLAILGFQMEMGSLRGQTPPIHMARSEGFGAGTETSRLKRGGQKAVSEEPLSPRARSGDENQVQRDGEWIRVDQGMPRVVGIPAYQISRRGAGPKRTPGGRLGGISSRPNRRRI